MKKIEAAESIALQGFSYILTNDALRDRFIALSGITPDHMRQHIMDHSFQLQFLEFFVHHEPDLLELSQHLNLPPDDIISAWRALGGTFEYM